MKVKCVKTIIDDPEIYQNDLHEHIKIGQEYIVYGLDIRQNKMIYYIIYNDCDLFIAPSIFFEIIETNVPDIWKIELFKDGDILIEPNLFSQKYFFEDFSERIEYARAEFEKIKLLFE